MSGRVRCSECGDLVSVASPDDQYAGVMCLECSEGNSITLWLSQKESAVLYQLAREQDLTPEGVLRQALRLYQLAKANLEPSDSPGCGEVE